MNIKYRVDPNRNNFFQLSFKALGGPFQIKILNSTNNNLTSIVEPLLKIVGKFEQNFSEFIPTSEVSLINRDAYQKPVQVSEECLDLLNKSLQLSNLTQGHFDLTFNSYLKEVRRLQQEIEKQNLNDEEILHQLDQLQSLRKSINYKSLQIENHRIKFSDPNIKISFGGIGKGYLVDKLYRQLRSQRVNNFLINGNGDIRTHADQFSIRPWHISILNPFNPQNNIGYLPVRSKAIASSGNYIRALKLGSFLVNHIVEKKEPEQNPIQGITLMTDECYLADALCTALFSMADTNQILNFAQKNNITIFLIDKEGKVITNNFDKTDAFSPNKKQGLYHAI